MHVGLLGAATAGVLAVAFATRSGIGLSTDSVVYMDGARRLAQGEGFTAGFSGHVAPITHWPPLYSAALAGLALFGIDPLVGARIRASLLFGATAAAAGWLIRRRAAGGVLPALATAVLVLVSADPLEVHSWAWSEPLFLLLCVLGLHQLAAYLEQPDARRRLVGAVFVALAALTRYLGVTLILAGGTAVLWLSSERRLLRRVADAARFGVIGATPLGVWLLRNRLLGGSSTDRSLIVNPIGPEHLREAAHTAAAWLVPPVLPRSARLVLLLCLGAAILIGLARSLAAALPARVPTRGRLLRLLLWTAAVYGVVLALSVSLLDPLVSFDSRILSPLHLLLVLAVGAVLADRRATPGWRRWLLLAPIAAVVALQAWHAGRWARIAADGLGYARPAVRESTLWSEIERLPPGTPLYSNAYDVVYVHTGRATRPLPDKLDPRTLVTFIDPEQYRAVLASLRDRLAPDGGVVVYVRTLERWRTYMPTEAELEAGLAPVERQELPDGSLFRVRQ